MKSSICDLGCSIFLALTVSVVAQETNPPAPIDLPTALRLAGAQNLDVQIAREKLAEAKANHLSAASQFFPWISPGITHRRHDGKIQEVQGNIIDIHKYSYAPGGTVGVQLDLGDAIYTTLAAKQLAKAADFALEAKRQDTVLEAAQNYFELAYAQSAVAVANESVRISSSFENQLNSAVEAGVAFKGDLLRSRVQAERNRLLLRQAQEQQRIASAKLAQTLRLDPATALTVQETELAPLSLIDTNMALDAVVAHTLSNRAELRESASLTAAARESKYGATHGPWIPSIGAQGFWGGLGGGRDGVGEKFGSQEDYVVGLSWRIGPGGLFDFGRVRSAEARLRMAGLNSEKLRDSLKLQVLEAFTRWRSLRDQLASTQRALTAANEGLQLAQQRKEFAVGIVLETIQSEQDLTRARLDYLKAVADFNKAQYNLLKATGEIRESGHSE